MCHACLEYFGKSDRKVKKIWPKELDLGGPGGYNFDMRAVGIKDLKNNLSSFLDFVRGGETILILDRNQPIAVIKKFDQKSDLTKQYLEEAIASNSIIPAKNRKGINIPKSILLNAGIKSRVSPAWREAYQADRD